MPRCCCQIIVGDFSATKKSVGNRKLKKEMLNFKPWHLEVQKNLRT